MKTLFNIRQQFNRELVSWSLIAFTMSAFEGGVAGVLVNHIFSGQVSTFWLSQAIAIVAGAPALANLSSPLWSRLEHGQNKVKLVAYLLMGSSISLLLFVVSSVSPIGLLMVVSASLIGRICWTGVVTTRSSLWRANYPRYIRAKITASFALPMSIILASTGVLIGWLSETSLLRVKLLYIGLFCVGMFGAYLYSSLQLRGAHKLSQDENKIKQTEGQFNYRMLLRILVKDKKYRHYMGIMFLFGAGNLMFMAPLILILNDQFQTVQWQQILITTSIPLAAMPLTINLWAKLLNKTHIIPYRAIHSWSFVIAIGLFALASVTEQSFLLWPASLVFGTAIAGAVLGWNLGHHDFTTPERASHYMAVHVTLTGIRGLIMPILGVNLYYFLAQLEPNLVRYTLIFPFLLSLMGAISFVIFARSQKHA
jgi:MFS family permease